MIDRRDGRVREKTKVVPGQTRGGKYSGMWGRANSEAAMGDWVAPGSNDRIKQMAIAHRLFQWQVLTEALDLFAKTYGEKPKDRN